MTTCSHSCQNWQLKTRTENSNKAISIILHLHTAAKIISIIHCFSCFYEEDSPRCDQRPCTSLGNDKGTNKQLFIDENR